LQDNDIDLSENVISCNNSKEIAMKKEDRQMKRTDRSIKQKTAESILDYWYTLEFLSQDALPALTYEEKKKNKEALEAAEKPRVYSNAENEKECPKVLKLLMSIGGECDLLEQVSAEAKRHGMACWGNITIYVGKSRREYCIQKIAQVLQEHDNRPEISQDEIAWYGLQLDPSGNYVEKSFALSTIIWAMNRIKKQADKSMAYSLSDEDFRVDEAVFENYFKNISGVIQTSTAVNNVDFSDEVEPGVTDLQETGSFSKQNNGDQQSPNPLMSKHILSIYQEIYKKYLKGSIDDDQGYSCLLCFQAYIDEETRDKYEEEDYSGLGRTYFANDLKLILSKLKSGEIDSGDPMQEALIDYIVCACAEAYPEKKLIALKKRIDMEHPEPGDEDGRKMLGIFADILDVKNAPTGKWPSRFMPALMQQTAVNLAVSENGKNGPVFSVNGPPGTGKTTLLKEIIVHNVIQKALLLSEYQNPDDAFEECSFSYGEKKNHGYSDYYSKYYKLKNDKINDYSILVTSCNNTAVENITKELPLEAGITGALFSEEKDSALFTEKLQEVSRLFTVKESEVSETLYRRDAIKNGEYKDIYFSEYASSLLEHGGAWGLISAALGKKSNIHQFYQKVMYNLDMDFYGSTQSSHRKESYQQARQMFLKQKEKVDELQKELVQNCKEEKQTRVFCAEGEECIQKLRQENINKEVLLKDYNQRLEQSETQIKRQQRELSDKEQEFQVASTKLEEAQNDFKEADCRYEEKLKRSIEVRGSISLGEKLFFRRNAKVKEALADKYATEAQNTKHELETLKAVYEERIRIFENIRLEKESVCDDLEKTKFIKANLLQSINSIQSQIKDNETSIEILGDSVKKARKDYKEALEQRLKATADVDKFTALDELFMKELLSEDEQKSTDAQTSNPWFTAHYNREREKLFYHALQLTKAFILQSKYCLRNYRNLALLWQESKVDKEKVSFHPLDREACFAPLLQSLFLLVPVISTTFASVGNFLRDIKIPGAIGTLIVDEAGQAPPQMAVGALYRSRQAIIVGDPKQVEPVVLDDLQLLKKAYQDDVYKPYKSKRLSVQQFADSMNLYGTYMDNEENEPEWLGCPLVVHRRCISPMYEISNYISYHNTMKQKTKAPSEKKEATFCYTGSKWINVTGKEKGKKNHFVEAQGKRVLEILEIAFSKSDSPSLFIITPFTTVKTGMIKCIENSLYHNHTTVIYQKRTCVKKWMYQCIGTVHTFQGKEANEVIFLLGCDSGKESEGAINWVNSNIVNVAVTRAKYRLYMIGDERAWNKSVYISQAKSQIDLYALRELGSAVYGAEGENGQERRDRVFQFYDQLPSAESVPIDLEENGDGETEYLFSPEVYLSELRGGGLPLSELTDEQLNGYGFTRESFQSLNPQVREYIEWGIKLYSMFKKLMVQYKLVDIDTSCCAILFCKAVELQVKECFYEGVKKHFPNEPVRGFGSSKGLLKNAVKKEMTLGTFQMILHDDRHKKSLSEYMKKLSEFRYDKAWWDQYDNRLHQCKNLRNSCCHCEKFLWEQTNDLLTVLFLRDRTKQEPIMDGVIRDSEIGRKL